MSQETEVEIYGRITNRAGLDQAVSHELQEQSQYEIPTRDGSKRKVRVRMSVRGGDVRYEETIKTKKPGQGGSIACTEVTTQISKDYYEAWKQTYGAPVVSKMRYVFMAMDVTATVDGREEKLPDLKYEVDVLIGKDGKQSSFCKIDVEIDETLAYLKQHFPGYELGDLKVVVTRLPLGLEDVFMPDSDENRKAVREFFSAFERPAMPDAAVQGFELKPVQESDDDDDDSDEDSDDDDDDEDSDQTKEGDEQETKDDDDDGEQSEEGSETEQEDA